MTLFYFFLSLTISLGAILFLRFLDRNNRSFEKISRLSSRMKLELERESSSNLERMRSFQEDVDNALDRADSVLRQLKENAENGEKKIVSSLDPQWKTRIANLEKSLEETRLILNDNSSPMTVSKNIKNLIKDSMKEIKGMRTELKEIRTEIETEKKETIRTLDLHNKDVGRWIANYRKELDLFVAEQWKIFSKQNEELKSDLTRVSEKMNRLKEEQLAQYQSDLQQFEEAERKTLLRLREDTVLHRTEVEKEIEKKVSDYSAYFVRLEDRVQEFAQKVDREIKRDIEGKILEVNGSYTSKMEELNQYTEQLKTDARGLVLKIVREYEAKNEGMMKEFHQIEEKSSEKIAEYRDFLNGSLINLEKIREDIFHKITDKEKELDAHLNNASELGLKLELKVFDNIKAQLKDFRDANDAAISDLDQKTKVRLEENRTKLLSFESEIFDRNNRCGETLEKLEEAVRKMQESTGGFARKTTEDMEGINKELLLFKEKIAQNIERIGQDSQEKVRSSLEYFGKEREKSSQVIRQLLEEMEKDFERRTEELSLLLKGKYGNLDQELKVTYQQLEKKAAEFDTLINNNAEGIRGEIEKKHQLMEAKVSEQLSEIESGFDIKKNVILEQIDHFDYVVKKALEDFDHRLGGTDSRMEQIEKEYFEKGQELLQNAEETAAQLEKRSAGIQENIVLIQNNLQSDLNALIESGRQLTADTMEKGRKEVVRLYQELEAENNAKISEYKENLSKMKQNVKMIEDKFDLQLEEKLENIDSKLELKLEMYNEKYRSNVNELIEKTDVFGSEFQRRLENTESEFSKKTVQLTNENRRQMEELWKGVSELREKLAKLGENMDSEVDTKIIQGKNMLDEQYRILETDTIRRINDYKNELLSVRQNLDALNDRFEIKMKENSLLIGERLEEKYEELHRKNETYLTAVQKQADSLQEEFKNKLSSVLGETESDLKVKYHGLETEYTDKFSNLFYENQEKFSEFSGGFENLKIRLEELKEKVDGDVAQKIHSGLQLIQTTLEEKTENANQLFRRSEEEVVNRFEEYRADFIKIQQNMKQIDERFTSKFLEHSSILDKRIAVIESEVKRFEKHTQIFDKAANVKEKLFSEIRQLMEQVGELKAQKVEMDELEKKIVKINSVAINTDAKYTDILNSNKKIENMENAMAEIRTFVDDVEGRLEGLNDAKIAIGNVESHLELVNRKYKDVESLISNLEQKETDLKRVLDGFGRADGSVKEIESKISLITRKIDDLQFKEDTYEKSLKSFEKESGLILQSQDKVMAVIARFNEMDSLVEDLEQRTNAINRHREWLVKAQTQIENLNAASDKKIKSLEALLNVSEQGNGNKRAEKTVSGEDNVKESVIKLSRQGWAIDDIAKALNLSTGEVEFIIDLEFNVKK